MTVTDRYSILEKNLIRFPQSFHYPSSEVRHLPAAQQIVRSPVKLGHEFNFWRNYIVTSRCGG